MFQSIKFFLTIMISLQTLSCGLRKGSDSQVIKAPMQNLVNGGADILLFSGKGEWIAEVFSLRQLLFERGLSYKTVTANELNEMSLGEMIESKLLIIPGGDSDIISATLLTDTGVNLRSAVQEHGLNYLGFCAGAWLAVAPKPIDGMDPDYGLGIVDGKILKAPKLKIAGTDKLGMKYAMPLITLANGTKRYLLWYGGPVTPEVPGGVLARFEDGTPAISQIMSGKGLVTIAGVHPTANKEILSSINMFVKEAIAPEITMQLIESGLNKKLLPAFK